MAGRRPARRRSPGSPCAGAATPVACRGLFSGWPLPVGPQGQTHTRCPLGPTRPRQQSEPMGQRWARQDVVEPAGGPQAALENVCLLQDGEERPEGQIRDHPAPSLCWGDVVSSPLGWAAAASGAAQRLGGSSPPQSHGDRAGAAQAHSQAFGSREICLPRFWGFLFIIIVMFR